MHAACPRSTGCSSNRAISRAKTVGTSLETGSSYNPTTRPIRISSRVYVIPGGINQMSVEIRFQHSRDTFQKYGHGSPLDKEHQRLDGRTSGMTMCFSKERERERERERTSEQARERERDGEGEWGGERRRIIRCSSKASFKSNLPERSSSARSVTDPDHQVVASIFGVPCFDEETCPRQCERTLVPHCSREQSGGAVVSRKSL